MKKTVLPQVLAVVFLASTGATLLAQSGQDLRASRNSLFAHPSIEQAWQTAVAEKRPLLVMFTSEQCVHCRKMLSKTYGHPIVHQMLASETETVLARAEDYRVLIKRLGIRGYPSTLLISPQGQVLDLMEGYLDAQKFAKRVSPLLAKKTTRVGHFRRRFATWERSRGSSRSGSRQVDRGSSSSCSPCGTRR